MTLAQAQELAQETGKPWLLAPDWAGASALPLADYTRRSGATPSLGQLERKGFTLALPKGSSVEDLIHRNELVD